MGRRDGGVWLGNDSRGACYQCGRPLSIPDSARIWMGRDAGIDDGCTHELLRTEGLSGGDWTVAGDSNWDRLGGSVRGRLRVRQIRKLYAGVLFDRRIVFRWIAAVAA